MKDVPINPYVAKYPELFAAKKETKEMKDDSLSDVHPMQTLINNINSGNSVGKQENVYAKQIWNDAIETAAKEASEQEYGHEAALEIRKLKK